MDTVSKRLSIREWLIYIAVYIALSFAAAWLFYDSFVPVIVFALFIPLFIKSVKRLRAQKITEKLTEEFLRSLISVSTSLSAGISPENAFAAAISDMEKMYGKRSLMARELSVINSRVKMGVRLGDALKDFAKRTGIQEIYDFSVVFSVAKDNGADFSTVISSTVEMMEKKRQAECDARVLIRAKQYEQRVMCVIPPGILAYLRLSSGGFIGILYHEPKGIIIMTACLLIYVMAICLSEKIGDIAI